MVRLAFISSVDFFLFGNILVCKSTLILLWLCSCGTITDSNRCLFIALKCIKLNISCLWSWLMLDVWVNWLLTSHESEQRWIRHDLRVINVVFMNSWWSHLTKRFFSVHVILVLSPKLSCRVWSRMGWKLSRRWCIRSSAHSELHWLRWHVVLVIGLNDIWIMNMLWLLLVIPGRRWSWCLSIDSVFNDVWTVFVLYITCSRLV